MGGVLEFDPNRDLTFESDRHLAFDPERKLTFDSDRKLAFDPGRNLGFGKKGVVFRGFICPLCGASVTEDQPDCTECGAVFDRKQPPRAREPSKPTHPAPPRPPPEAPPGGTARPPPPRRGYPMPPKRPEIRHCVHCGARISADDAFCWNCGSRPAGPGR